MHKNNLIAENKIIITTSDSFHVFKIFAILMPLYLTFQTAKAKIKLLSYFFPNSHGSYTVPEIWQVTHVIVTFHFGLFFALPPSPL